MMMLYKYWKELFELGIVYMLETPIVKVKYKKENISFHSLEMFEEWKEKHKNEKFESKYYKGLGTSSSKEWKEYLSVDSLHDNLIQLKIENEEDRNMFELLFSKANGMTDKRKEWLQLEEDNGS
jgi:DNA topoisomerase-2